jgi:hypothetical protein
MEKGADVMFGGAKYNSTGNSGVASATSRQPEYYPPLRL